MILPQAFDENEWFLCITFIIGLILFLRLPSRFPRTVTVLVFVFTIFIGKLVDMLIGIGPFDFYDIHDTPSYDLFDLFTWFTYSFFGYFLVYGYDRFQFKSYFLWLYIIGWAAGATVFEWISKFFNVFDYRGWHSSYSFCFYLVAISVTLLYFRFVKQQFFKMKQQF